MKAGGGKSVGERVRIPYPLPLAMGARRATRVETSSLILLLPQSIEPVQRSKNNDPQPYYTTTKTNCPPAEQWQRLAQGVCR